MRFFDIKLQTPKGDHVDIFPVSCLHIGHRLHDKPMAEDYRDYILRTPDTYAVSLGDDIDNAIPGDEAHNSMTYENNMTPAEQLRAAVEFWKPLVKKGKLLWTHDSNHWWRTEAKTGISAAEHMNIFLGSGAKRGSAPKWGRWQAMSRIRVGKQVYLVHSWHGAGGGTTAASALRNCQKKSDEVVADLYLVGHYHKKVVYEDKHRVWPANSPHPVDRKRAFACTGCFLNWDESYGERFGLPMGMTGAVKATLFKNEHLVRVSL